MRAVRRGGQGLTRAAGESDRAATLLAFGARTAVIATATLAAETAASTTTTATSAATLAAIAARFAAIIATAAALTLRAFVAGIGVLEIGITRAAVFALLPPKSPFSQPKKPPDFFSGAGCSGRAGRSERSPRSPRS